MITPAGTVSTLADNSKANGTGDLALLRHPIGVAIDSAGNVYVADHDNNAVRMITSAGVVTTIASSASSGYADGDGATALFNQPTAIADSAGNLYVTE